MFKENKFLTPFETSGAPFLGTENIIGSVSLQSFVTSAKHRKMG